MESILPISLEGVTIHFVIVVQLLVMNRQTAHQVFDHSSRIIVSVNTIMITSQNK